MPEVYEIQCSCGSVYIEETKRSYTSGTWLNWRTKFANLLSPTYRSICWKKVERNFRAILAQCIDNVHRLFDIF
ncbi:hypothetical protein J6590_086416 [Homalodisca vitripennis]|nr:hypothetical protein J6590_086416 [Homalodisca vitripennis]